MRRGRDAVARSLTPLLAPAWSGWGRQTVTLCKLTTKYHSLILACLRMLSVIAMGC